MTFMNKPSWRVAILLSGLSILSCQLPEPRTGPDDPHLARVVVTPPAATLHVDDTTALTALGQTSAGDAAPMLVTFEARGSSGGQITDVSTPAMGRAIGRFRAGPNLGLDTVVVRDTSGYADTTIITVTPMPVASVTLAPSAATILRSTSTTFSATLRDAAGTVLTGRAIAWSSTNPLVATVNAAGVATGVAVGSSSIIATSEGVSDTATVTVVNVPVASVTVSPASATIFVGTTRAFTATTRDSAGGVLTGRVITWSSTAPSVATVNSAGVATGVAAGSVSIIATSEGKSDTASLTVNIVPVATVTVTPATASVNVGATQAFTATLRDSAGGVLTGRIVTWSSSAPSIATVNTSGVATGVAAGSTSIIATSEGKADTSALTVTVPPPPPPPPAPVATVTVTPASASVFVARTQAFTATLRDSAGGVLTGRVVTWSSTAPAVATVNSSGVATGVVPGSASIIATSEGKSDTSSLTVTLVPVATVTVTPATASVNVGATQAFTATLRDSAGGVLTGRVVTWLSTAIAIATINTSGLATGVAAGSTSIIATSEGKADTSALTVTVPPPPPPPGAVPDPTLLPLASGQAPNGTAYNALNIRTQPAGSSYNDPVTGVRVWKATSASVPTGNSSAGHDYADGGNRASLGWGAGNNTHTILIRGDGMQYYLVDFTRGVGFSNYRALPAAAQPDRDLCFSFSNLASQPRIAYVINNDVLKRFNTQTMQVENTGSFPRTVNGHFAWLHHDRNDTWFVGVLNGNTTAWAFNSQTNQFLTHNEAWSDEVRLERDGRYAVMGNGGDRVRFWDLSNNTFGPAQTNANFWFAHNASMRSRWVTANPNANSPWAEDRYEVSGGQIIKTQILNQSAGTLVHHSGNWIQTDAELGGNLNRQWSYLSGYEANNVLLWRQAIGVQRADGSDQRLLLHHYSVNPPYFGIPWGTPSPDGKIVIFNSNMNGGPRYDLFVAEVPLR